MLYILGSNYNYLACPTYDVSLGQAELFQLLGQYDLVDLVPGLPDSSETGKGYVSRGKSYYLNVATDGTKTVSTVIIILINMK